MNIFITGANRGIGLELVSFFCKINTNFVWMGGRDFSSCKKQIEENNWHNVEPIKIDVSDEQSIISAADLLKSREIKIDIFINNAGASLDWIPNGESIRTLDIEYDTLCYMYRVNTFAPIYTTKHFLPIMNDNCRIVNVSSGAGELWDKNASSDFQVAYASSKLALLMITKKIAASSQLRNRGIVCNAVCPDWCNTRMGGKDATHSAKYGAESIVSACFIDKINAPTGRYFRRGQLIPVDVLPSNHSCEYNELVESITDHEFIVKPKNKILQFIFCKIKYRRLREINILGLFRFKYIK